MRRLLKKNKAERLTAEAALRDPWFLDIKNGADDELIRSVCLNKNEMSFNPKLSVNMSPVAVPETAVTRWLGKGGEKEHLKAFPKLKEEAEVAIFGMEEAMRI